MSTLQQIRLGLEKAWEGLKEGWQEFYNHTAQALTRFTPRPEELLETADKHPACRWGMLAAEVRETEEALTVKLEAPGMAPEDFALNVEGDILVIRGEKHFQRETNQGHYHFMECAYGQFERAFPLPVKVDETRAQATYKRGVLWVTLPKVAGSGKKRIPVQSQ